MCSISAINSSNLSTIISPEPILGAASHMMDAAAVAMYKAAASMASSAASAATSDPSFTSYSSQTSQAACCSASAAASSVPVAAAAAAAAAASTPGGYINSIWSDQSNFMRSFRFYYYDWWNDETPIKEYPFLDGGPWKIITMVAAYLYFVKVLGPELMKDRKPFDLKWLIRIYNFSMVAFNAYLFVQACKFLNFGLWCWGCTIGTQRMADETLPIVSLVLISRFFDFLDTVFFVLRKKYSHVSFLHVFHHAAVPIGFWIGIKFAFVPVCCFLPFINLFVHVIMYSYYGLATWKSLQPYLWWKKYLTRLQIIQFILALVHSLQPIYMPTCKFPGIFVWGQTLAALIFLWLFCSFYVKAYTVKPSELTKEQQVIGKGKCE